MKMAGNMWLTMIYHRVWFTNCRCSYPITKVLSGGTMPLVYGLWSSIPWEYPSIWVTMVPQFTCEIPDLKTSKWVTSQETLTLLVSVISAMIITNLKYQTSYIILPYFALEHIYQTMQKHDSGSMSFLKASLTGGRLSGDDCRPSRAHMPRRGRQSGGTESDRIQGLKLETSRDNCHRL